MVNECKHGRVESVTAATRWCRDCGALGFVGEDEWAGDRRAAQASGAFQPALMPRVATFVERARAADPLRFGGARREKAGAR